MSAGSFRYDSLVLAVEAPEADLVWLEEFLGPAFPRDTGVPGVRVELTRDTAAHRDFREQGAASGKAPVAFCLEGGGQRLEGWTPPPVAVAAGSTVFDPELAVFLALSPSARSVRVLAEAGDSRARVALMRVVRELAMRHAQCRGGRVFHAAACARSGRGLLIAGPRGAGKSSLLTYLLHQPRVAYLANDRVLGRWDSRMLGLREVPTIVAQRPGTVRRFPRLRRVPWHRDWLHRQTLAEVERAQGATGAPWPPDLTYNLTPAQLVHQLEVERRSEAVGAAVLFPEVGASRLALERLSPGEVESGLAAACFPAPAGDDFFAPLDPAQGTQTPLSDLAAQIPGFRCRLDDAAFDSGALAGRLLAHLEDSSSPSRARSARAPQPSLSGTDGSY